ncbi:MAG: hypothetical protein U1F39_03450 [Steroidobacteraceae bacterium]
MTRISIAIAAALLMTGSAWAKPELDSAGKCRDNGKFVAQAACTTAAPAAKCRDKATKKFAKCDAANTEPVPEKAKAK